MKNKTIRFLRLFLLFVSVLILSGCSDDVTPSLYTPGFSSAEAPQITSVEPSSEAIAAVTSITITGKNFANDTSQVRVYFGKQLAKIVSGSPTQLVVLSPNVTGSMKIKVSTRDAVAFSNTYDYLLRPAAKDHYPNAKDIRNNPLCIAIDKSENIYTFNFTLGIIKLSSDSVESDYSAKGGESNFNSMRFGPDGTLYCVRGLQAIFSIPPGGGVKNTSWLVLKPSTLKISKIDFDPLGNMWAAGKNTDIVRIKPDLTYVLFPFNYNVTAMRIFVENNTTYIYTVVDDNGAIKILRIPLDANGDPGTPQEYFDFSAKYGTSVIVNDMTFAADGELILSTNLTSPIVYIKPDKSSGLLYEGLLKKASSLSLFWGPGNFLYYVREEIQDAAGAKLIPSTIVKLNMLKPGAPYYGM